MEYIFFIPHNQILDWSGADEPGLQWRSGHKNNPFNLNLVFMCICPLQMNVSLYILYNRALYLSTCQHNALEADLKIITGFCKTEFGVICSEFRVPPPPPPVNNLITRDSALSVHQPLPGINNLIPRNSAWSVNQSFVLKENTLRKSFRQVFH